MRHKNFPEVLSYLVLLLICFMSTEALGQRRGRVVSESGEPLSGVTITDNIYYRVTTESDGRFQLDPPNVARYSRDNPEVVVRFKLSGYIPTTRVLKLASESEIVMKKSDEAEWRPPVCTNDHAWYLMVFTIPKRAKVGHGGDVDFFTEGVQFGKYTLLHAWGPTWSWGLPLASFFKDVVHIEERDVFFKSETSIAEYKGAR